MSKTERYSLPMLAGMILQQVYKPADSIIADNAVGEAALGAVGICYPLTACLVHRNRNLLH